MPDPALDLGSFDDEAMPIAPETSEVEAEIAADDADKPLPVSVYLELYELGDEHRFGPRALAIAEALVRVREAVAVPKPKVEEMIETMARLRARLEDGELRLVALGQRPEPYAPTMRDAAVLGAAVNFLTILEANKEAVRKALSGGRGGR